MLFQAPTYAFATGSSTITDAATVAITGAPILGTNAVFTRSMALWIQGGVLRTDGGIIRKLRSVASTSITVAATDHYVLSSTGGGAVAASLPASPETGREYIIKDNAGDAGSFNITITPAAGNIDGSATAVINTNFGVARLIYNGTQWNIVGENGSNIL